MKIVAEYDFNGERAAVRQKYAAEFAQIKSVISAIDASICKTKESTEKTMMGKMLFSPILSLKAMDEPHFAGAAPEMKNSDDVVNAEANRRTYG